MCDFSEPDTKAEEVDAEMSPGPSNSEGMGVSKEMAMPDMSIILEQSVLDVEDSLLAPQTHMNTGWQI